MSRWALGQSFASGGGTVRWDRWGHGEPVVLLHGTPFSSFLWRDITRALADRYEVFAWDMLGYGASEKKDGQNVSLAAQADVFTGVPPAIGEDLTARIPGARLRWLDGAGHLVQENAPAQLTAALTDFLAAGQ
jgi:pimeloyl-ACP methyl ester carboxylesterase